MSKRMQEPVDQWLGKEGYFRKPTPRDPTCLFRAVSEQIYHTQHYHLRVRRECIEFMQRERHLFTNSMTSFDYYIEEMQCFTEWGGPNEIRAMSLLYNRDIIIFIAEKKICENVTNNYKEGVILLCHTEPKQYEPVYPMAFVQSAAYCQSIVYEVVYKYMYNMPNVKTVADKMLHNRNATLRHDKFFQKGNLDIRGQLVEDLYKKVRNGHSDTDEAQSEWKGTPPIPYKVAKALAPDYYRNIELDIWHELKREVKSAGWNRYNSNELQVGGKCLIEISINDLQRCERNKKFCVNLSDYGTSEGDHKIEQQKLKQGPLWLHGYIQEMNTSKEPVLVFIKDLGEKKFVPYDALKPLPITKKNRQKNWVSINRNHSMNSDTNRRWRKSYNFTRKRKDTLSMTNGTTSNTNKNILINDVVDSDNNNISKISFENDGYDSEFSKINKYQIESHTAEDYSEDVINEKADNQSTEVTSDNSQSTMLNNVIQETVEERHKKTDTIFKRMNNTTRNKTEKPNNYDNSFQNSCSKPKISDENHHASYNGNSQVNTNGNPNMSYVMSDNNTYPFYPYVPGNFGEHNQMDHSFASNFFYNLHLLHLEDTFRILNPTCYGTVAYGSGYYGVQPLGVPSNANNIPYMQDVDRIVNGMQNCSLTCNEEASIEIPSTSNSNNNSVPNARLPKQGLKNLNGKDSSYQAPQKGKQTGTTKGNRTRNRQNVRGSAYAQHSTNNCATILNTSSNICDARRYDALAQQSQHHWDGMFHQMTPMVASAYATPQYAPPNMLPAMPYHELPSHCANENGVGNLPYYLGNGSYMPMPYLPTQHVDAIENAAIAPYPQHLYPGETYSSYPLNPGQPMPTYPPPLMYPQSMQYPAMLPPPPPPPPQSQPQPLPPSHMQEQWNPTLQPYMQCSASQAIVDSPSNGQGIGTL